MLSRMNVAELTRVQETFIEFFRAEWRDDEAEQAQSS